jgi:hypothetical protein
MTEEKNELVEKLDAAVSELQGAQERSKLALSLVGPDAVSLEPQHRLESRVDAILDITSKLADAQIATITVVRALAASSEVEMVEEEAP